MLCETSWTIDVMVPGPLVLPARQHRFAPECTTYAGQQHFAPERPSAVIAPWWPWQLSTRTASNWPRETHDRGTLFSSSQQISCKMWITATFRNFYRFKQNAGLHTNRIKVSLDVNTLDSGATGVRNPRFSAENIFLSWVIISRSHVRPSVRPVLFVFVSLVYHQTW